MKTNLSKEELKIVCREILQAEKNNDYFDADALRALTSSLFRKDDLVSMIGASYCALFDLMDMCQDEIWGEEKETWRKDCRYGVNQKKIDILEDRCNKTWGSDDDRD